MLCIKPLLEFLAGAHAIARCEFEGQERFSVQYVEEKEGEGDTLSVFSIKMSIGCRGLEQ